MNDRGLVFKSLADPTRRRILEHLREGDLNAGEVDLPGSARENALRIPAIALVLFRRLAA